MYLSLKKKITLLTSLSVLVIGLIAIILVHLMMKDQKRLMVEKFSSYAESLGSAISSQFYERYGDAQAFSYNDALKTNDKASMESALNNYTKLYGIYDLILYVDLQGNLIASNTVDIKGNKISSDKLKAKNFSNESWFKAVLGNQFVEDKEKGFKGTHFEGPYKDSLIDEVYGGESWATSFSAPVMDSSGKVIGILSNRSNMEWVEQEVRNTYNSMKNAGLAKAEMVLVNKEGLFIVEHTPDETKDPTKVKRDWEVLNKVSLVEEHPDLWDLLKVKNIGVKLTYDLDLGYNQVAGFTKLNNSKFIDSIGWTVVVMESEEDLFEYINIVERKFILFFLASTFICIFISTYFATRFGNELSEMATKLKLTTESMLFSLKNLNELSSNLKSDSIEQERSVHQVVSTLDEVNAMLEKTNESAQQSKDTVLQAVHEAENGQATVVSMLDAIKVIQNMNDEFAKKTEITNNEISEIVNLINNVNTKTKVINEIVFQTKLLSFNASVEAARAGEAGKGFAVVAEEVGKLAEMSGTSALEISQLLESSTLQVKEIVAKNQTRLNELFQTSSHNIKVGIDRSKECKNAFDKILEGVNLSNQSTDEITNASKEQSIGVRDIALKLKTVDEMTQKNATGASECADTVDQLDKNAHKILETLEDFNKFVNGQNKLDKY